MRKVPLLLAGALALVLGVAGIAQAVNSQQTITVKMTGNKVTKAKKKGVGLFTVDLKVNQDPSDQPFATKTTVIHFDKNLVFNYNKFKTCTEEQARVDAAACKPAKVGSGAAQGVALGQTEDLKVTVYNGTNGHLLLHTTGSAPLIIDSVIVGTLQGDSGPYGKKLVVEVPENLQQPVTGVYATLTRFMTKIEGSKKGKKSLPYIALKGCPADGKLKFKGDFTFTDGSSQSPTTTVPCKKK